MLDCFGRTDNTARCRHNSWCYRTMRVVRRERPRMPTRRIVSVIFHVAAGANRFRADAFVLDFRRFGPAKHRLGTAETVSGRSTVAHRCHQATGGQPQNQCKGCDSSRRRHGVPPWTSQVRHPFSIHVDRALPSNGVSAKTIRSNPAGHGARRVDLVLQVPENRVRLQSRLNDTHRGYCEV
jgi:hypothetical protein